MREQDRPRLLPSLKTPASRYSVPPKPDFASQMSPRPRPAAFTSSAQQAWSLTIQSTRPSSTICQRNSTSARGRMGGLTFA